MAKSDSKVVKQSVRKAPAPSKFSDKQYATIGRDFVAKMEAFEREEAERAKAFAAGASRPPFVLTEKARKQATHTLEEMNFAFVSIHRLSIAAVDDGENGEWFATAIENMAKIGSRKADVVAALLGSDILFGNFSEEFEIPRAHSASGSNGVIHG